MKPLVGNDLSRVSSTATDLTRVDSNYNPSKKTSSAVSVTGSDTSSMKTVVGTDLSRASSTSSAAADLKRVSSASSAAPDSTTVEPKVGIFFFNLNNHPLCISTRPYVTLSAITEDCIELKCHFIVKCYQLNTTNTISIF